MCPKQISSDAYTLGLSKFMDGSTSISLGKIFKMDFFSPTLAKLRFKLNTMHYKENLAQNNYGVNHATQRYSEDTFIPPTFDFMNILL